jgi:hypothetical protein
MEGPSWADMLYERKKVIAGREVSSRAALNKLITEFIHVVLVDGKTH